MSNDLDRKPTLDEVKEELQSTAFSSTTRILKYLASYYGGYFPDDYALNREFLKILATMIGEMLAHFPEEMLEEVVGETYRQIQYRQDTTAAEISAAGAEAEADPSDVQGIKKYDLAKMKPQGNC